MSSEKPEPAKILQKARRERDPALAREAAEQFHLCGDAEGEAEAYAFLGEMRFCTGSYREAEDFYKKSLDIYQLLLSIKGVAWCLFWISRCLPFTKEENDGADEISCLELALKAAEKGKEKELQIECCIKLGSRLRDRENARAFSFYNQALELLKNAEDGWLVAVCHQGLGHLYARETDYLKARRHYLSAIESFEEARANHADEVDVRLAQCMESAGDLALCDGESDEAENRFEQALQILVSMGDSRRSQRLRDKLGRLRGEEH